MNKESSMGRRIRSKRLMLGMTQEQLADQLFVTKATISFYENDTADIKCSILSELAKILKTTPDYLIWGVENKTDVTALDPDTAKLVTAFESITDPKIKRLILAQVSAAILLEV